MRIKSILATAAVVLGLGLGPALAAGPLSPEATGEGFAALGGVPAEALSAAEMAAVEGRFFRFSPRRLSSSSGGFTTLSLTSTNTSINFNIGTALPHPKWSEMSNPPGNFTGWSAP